MADPALHYQPRLLGLDRSTERITCCKCNRTITKNQRFFVANCDHAVHHLCAPGQPNICLHNECDERIDARPSIPILMTRRQVADAVDDDGDPLLCGICSKPSGEHMIGSISNCSHIYHQECIKKAFWIFYDCNGLNVEDLRSWKNWKCPLCRQPILSQKLMELLERSLSELAGIVRAEKIKAEFNRNHPRRSSNRE